MYTKHMNLTLTSARWRSLRRSREKEKNKEEAAREKQDQATKTTSTTCQEHYDVALFACKVSIKIVAIWGVSSVNLFTIYINIDSIWGQFWCRFWSNLGPFWRQF